MDIDWEGEFEDPPIELPKSGVCKKPWVFKFLIQNPLTGEVNYITKKIHSFSTTGIETKRAYYNTRMPFKTKKMSEITQADKNKGEEIAYMVPTSRNFIFYLLFAFIGGFILNFMPCVLPVISIKLFGIIAHSKVDRKKLLKHNLLYSLGVISTFLALALSIVLLKMSGTTVGWGFQLQSPIFVSIMIGALFIFALNLFGLFEFGTPGGRKLGGMELKDNYMGDFLSGVLATILSTPCSAPFLGTALTFAFTSATINIFLIFTMIGLGLSFPFILTAIFPKTISFLPKPGEWMNTFKKFLGLSLLLTAIWLYDVFIHLINDHSLLIYFNLLLATIFFAIYFKEKITKKKIPNLFMWITLVAMTALFTVEFKRDFQTPITVQADGVTKIGELSWEKWTPQKMKQKGRLVFVDFTAKWCFTCKMNEKIVLQTKDFKKLIKEYDLSLIMADWTKHDPIIGNWLKEHGYAGVPAYFVLSPQGKLYPLGEVISISKIRKTLEKALKE